MSITKKPTATLLSDLTEECARQRVEWHHVGESSIGFALYGVPVLVDAMDGEYFVRLDEEEAGWSESSAQEVLNLANDEAMEIAPRTKDAAIARVREVAAEITTVLNGVVVTCAESGGSGAKHRADFVRAMLDGIVRLLGLVRSSFPALYGVEADEKEPVTANEATPEPTRRTGALRALCEVVIEADSIGVDPTLNARDEKVTFEYAGQECAITSPADGYFVAIVGDRHPRASVCAEVVVEIARREAHQAAGLRFLDEAGREISPMMPMSRDLRSKQWIIDSVLRHALVMELAPVVDVVQWRVSFQREGRRYEIEVMGNSHPWYTVWVDGVAREDYYDNYGDAFEACGVRNE